MAINNYNTQFKNYSMYEGQNYKHHTLKKPLANPWNLKYDLKDKQGNVVMRKGDKLRYIFVFNEIDFMHDPDNYSKWARSNPTIALGTKEYTWEDDIKPTNDRIQNLQNMLASEDSKSASEDIQEELDELKSRKWAMKASNQGIYENVVEESQIHNHEDHISVGQIDYNKDTEIYENQKESVREKVDRQTANRKK